MEQAESPGSTGDYGRITKSVKVVPAEAADLWRGWCRQLPPPWKAQLWWRKVLS
jgi:hypothetical protein